MPTRVDVDTGAIRHQPIGTKSEVVTEDGWVVTAHRDHRRRLDPEQQDRRDDRTDLRGGRRGQASWSAATG